MSDRHVRRTGDDYGTQFLTYLPQGPAWSRQPGTILDLTCRGLADYYGTVDARAADLLEIESDPRTTVELLPDWERNWGLPDPCWSQAQTIGERQIELVLRMTMLGGQSRQFFISTAAYLGYTITISEYRPFQVGLDRCGDNRVIGDGTNPMLSDTFVRGLIPVCNPIGNRVALGETSEWPNIGLGSPDNRFYWTVHVHGKGAVWFTVGGGGGQCGIDPHLRISTATDLECILNRWKPAHTTILFDYSGLNDIVMSPPAAQLNDTQYTPTVVNTSARSIAPASAVLSDTQYAPTMLLTNNITVPKATLSDTQYAPTVTIIVNTSITPAKGNLTASGKVPTRTP